MTTGAAFVLLDGYEITSQFIQLFLSVQQIRYENEFQEQLARNTLNQNHIDSWAMAQGLEAYFYLATGFFP